MTALRKNLHSLLLNIFSTKFSATGKINREGERLFLGGAGEDGVKLH